jgi:hypothetical protein
MAFQRGVTALDAARLAQQQAMAHMRRCPALERGKPCERCRDLDAKAAGLYVRADYRPLKGSARGLPSNAEAPTRR